MNEAAASFKQKADRIRAAEAPKRTEIAEPPFHAARQALLFAFNFNHQQYDRPAMSKLLDKRRFAGRGLGGLDGAGQAGMVMQALRGLGALHAAILTADVAPRNTNCSCNAGCCRGYKPNMEWEESIGYLTDRLSQDLGGHREYAVRDGLLHSIVRRFFGIEMSITKLAETCGVNRDTASDHNAKATKRLEAERDNAWKACDDEFRRQGIIGAAEDS